MKLQLSDIGRKLTARSGILALMDDLGRAMSETPGMCMMGGGNPARIPAVESVWRARMREVMDDGDRYERMLANYDTPQGQPQFIRSLVGHLNDRFGWGLTERNIAVTNGSQTAYFLLFNLLAGRDAQGNPRRILFPLCPEYIGYADQGLRPDLFASCRPRIEMRGHHRFKYHVDFDRLEVGPDIAAICVSRPTNPTGNVLTNREIERLAALAAAREIPLIVDNAYGAPFPGIIFSEVLPIWNPGIILSLSLSKLGLPGTRTGILVAREDVIEAVSAANAIGSLANGNIGQTLVEPLLATGDITALCRDVIRPFYEQRALLAQGWVEELFDDDLDYHIHVAEGALFLWLWFRELPVSTQVLYERLKARHVLVVPGCHFFFGLQEPWRHRHECIRINFALNPDAVREGLRILADEVRLLYRQAPPAQTGLPQGARID
jgi:valine--pyruvate aminotransferase